MGVVEQQQAGEVLSAGRQKTHGGQRRREDLTIVLPSSNHSAKYRESDNNSPR